MAQTTLENIKPPVEDDLFALRDEYIAVINSAGKRLSKEARRQLTEELRQVEQEITHGSG
jgi:uncharacterized membrane protein